MTFLANTGLLDPVSVEPDIMIEHLGHIEGRFVRSTGDRYRFGKRFMLAAAAAGVEPGDEDRPLLVHGRTSTPGGGPSGSPCSAPSLGRSLRTTPGGSPPAEDQTPSRRSACTQGTWGMGVANHATWSSNPSAQPRGAAQGTCATVGPCSGHFTLGTSARRQRTVCGSSDLQLADPRPGRNPGIAGPAPTAATLGMAPGAPVDHHRVGLLIEIGVLDHRRPVDTERPTPSVGTNIAILSPRSLDRQAVRKLGRDGVVRVKGRPRHPRITQESLIS